MKTIPLDLLKSYHFYSNLQTCGSTVFAFTHTMNMDKNCYVPSLLGFINDKLVYTFSDQQLVNYAVYDDQTIILILKDGVLRFIDSLTYAVKKEVKTGLQIASVHKLDTKLLIVHDVDILEDDQTYGLSHGSDYQVVDEYPYFFNGQGYINKHRTTISVLNDDDSINNVLPKTFNIDNGCLMDDHTYAFVGFDFKDVLWKYRHIYKVDLLTNELTCLYSKNDFDMSKLFFLNDHLYVCATNGDTYGWMQQHGVYEVCNEQLVHVSTFEYALRNSVGSDCRYGKNNNGIVIGSKIYFTATIDYNAHLVSFDGTKFTEELTCNGGIDGFTKVGDCWYVIALIDQQLQTIYKVEDGQWNALTFDNQQVLADYYVAKPQHFTFESCNETVDGWVMLPPDYDETKTYPGLLVIHGGPKTAYGEVFYHEHQYWCGLGYVVMFCNPHGSDGKGDAFADMRKNYGGSDYTQIMDFVDTVLQKYPNVDANRLAVTGGSYGGYMTNWIIGHTTRFKAAVSQRSISNWVSMVMDSDYGYDFVVEQEFDDKFHCEKELWDCSPLKYVSNATTPTLFIHSSEDYRCPLNEAMQMYTGLRLNGVESKIVIFNKENHELSRSGKPLKRLKRLYEISKWINDHLN